MNRFPSTQRRTLLLSCLLIIPGVSGHLHADEPRITSPAKDGAAVTEAFWEKIRAAGTARSRYLRWKSSPAGSDTPKPRLTEFRKQIEPALARYCVDCHNAETQEGNIRIDSLDPNLLEGDDISWWLEVLAVLTKSEMPPIEADALPDADRAEIVDWLSTELQAASAFRRSAEGHSSFRRLNRDEFRYALQDLLGLPYDFSRDLPPDAVSADGFLNNSESLHMSTIQFGIFLDASRKALQSATVSGERPPPLYWSVSMAQASLNQWAGQDSELAKLGEQFKDDPEQLRSAREKKIKQWSQRPGNTHYRHLASGRRGNAPWGYGGAKYAWAPSESEPAVPSIGTASAIIPPGKKLTIELGNRIPDSGNLRVSVLASRGPDDTGEGIPSLQLEFGWQASNDSQAAVRVSQRDYPVEAEEDDPQLYEWVIPISEIYPRNSVRKTARMGETPSPSELIRLVNSSVSSGDVQIFHVNIAAPIYENWPPESHRNIFRNDGSPSDETAAARRILERFLTRAWRRPPTEEELDRKLLLFSRLRPVCSRFEEAINEVLATSLASPEFLYINRPVNAPAGNATDRRISSAQLATRLAIFLWSSIPDEPLMQLATSDQLHDGDVLQAQVRRMLDDPRAKRFAHHFTHQWLGLQLLEFLQVDRKEFPQFDPSLREAMLREPQETFQVVLDGNRSVLDLLHADSIMVNERLARHYGLSGVLGNEFREVGLEGLPNRGGLLSQPGLLAMNSDGKHSHPLKRGIWLLEKILHDPPPPPPPAVPEIDLADPEIARLTLKERMENHRNQAACRSCHARIDPWGIAFENFDATGSYRTAIAGQPVDASSELFNGDRLVGLDGLKRHLLTHRQDQFVRGLVHRLMTYALGRPLTFADRSSIDALTADLRRQGDGLETLILLIVESPLFQTP